MHNNVCVLQACESYQPLIVHEFGGTLRRRQLYDIHKVFKHSDHSVPVVFLLPTHRHEQLNIDYMSTIGTVLCNIILTFICQCECDLWWAINLCYNRKLWSGYCHSWTSTINPTKITRYWSSKRVFVKRSDPVEHRYNNRNSWYIFFVETNLDLDCRVNKLQ